MNTKLLVTILVPTASLSVTLIVTLALPTANWIRIHGKQQFGSTWNIAQRQAIDYVAATRC